MWKAKFCVFRMTFFCFNQPAMLFEKLFQALSIENQPHVSLIEAAALVNLRTPPFPPDAPALIVNLGSNIERLCAVLAVVYPADHLVKLIGAAETASPRVEALRLADLPHNPRLIADNWLYVPPVGVATSFEAFQEVVARLRAPDGCPWDREQTHHSLRSYLLEETYEVLAALDLDDPAKMCEEFGDLLLQIVLHAQIANEKGEFRSADILRGIHQKLVRRHPHVFGDVEVTGVSNVLQNWEKLKAEERKDNGKAEAGLLDGIPAALPALVQALEYQKRAARVGFDWPDVEGLLEKVGEEAREVRQAQNEAERAAEIGDLLFSVVNLARWYHVDAESMLRETNLRFKRRFAEIEKAARAQGKTVADLSLQEMDAIWEAAKTQEF